MTADQEDARSIRLAHLGEESAVRSLGQLCILVGFLCTLGVFELALLAVGVLNVPDPFSNAMPRDLIRVVSWAMAALLMVVAAGHWVLARGLIRLQSWARWTVVGLTGISLVQVVGFGVALGFSHPGWGLLTLAIGGALHAAVLYPLLRPGAALIFSARYREIIRATPEIRARMHGALKAALWSIGVGLVGLVAFLFYWIIS